MTIGLCITSIYPESAILRKNCEEWDKGSIHIALDKKSYQNGETNFPGYISIDRQPRTEYERSAVHNSYARKNISYLDARSLNDFIFETDDDNLIKLDRLGDPEQHFSSKDIITFEQNKNIFEDLYPERMGNIWARGYNLANLDKKISDVQSNIPLMPGVIQFLVDGNPDVDAIYRLVAGADLDLSVDELRLPLAVAKGWHPFNSQATLWRSSDIHLMYLPTYCNFRMTDIYRGYIAQRILKERNQHLVFEGVAVKQVRNQHSITGDFFGEHSGYKDVGKLIKILETIELSNMSEHQMLTSIYNELIKADIIEDQELTHLNAYLESCK